MQTELRHSSEIQNQLIFHLFYLLIQFLVHHLIFVLLDLIYHHLISPSIVRIVLSLCFFYLLIHAKTVL